MAVSFNSSQTKINLMRAFAGESQARNRYTFAADKARKMGCYFIYNIFTLTANQEKAHAEIFYNHLRQANGENIDISPAAYPVGNYDTPEELLRSAQHNEYEEHDDVYKHFGAIATSEGFSAVAASFNMIANIEKTHGDRFGLFADLLEQNKLFVSDVETAWMCLECGNIYYGTTVPEICPVCHHSKGYYVRLELAPYTGTGK